MSRYFNRVRLPIYFLLICINVGAMFLGSATAAIPGDIDGNETVDLADALISLQLIAKMNPSASVDSAADINGDEKIGIEEGVYALRVLAFYPVVVNSLGDIENPPEGVVTLRKALSIAADGQPIEFDPALDGQVIELTIVGEDHTALKGEVMGMKEEPSGPVSYLAGYFDRDYGKSALYARKNVVIDASSLPSGITIAWAGGESSSARVMAVYGNLTLKNVRITGGKSVTEDISADNPDQLWTLARGGALAVWGEAYLDDCILYDNHCVGDFDSSRDRGAFGGGIYANIVDINNCVISGNSVLGGGAAGGGVYSVGGAESIQTVSFVRQSAVTGNRISGLFAYGAGVYSDGGGIENRKTLSLVNTTIADNLAEPAPGLPPFLLGMGYWRGGGVYMSNGHLYISGCTITRNAVYGVPRTTELDKPNMAGGIAATIGNAHAVERMAVAQSIITGNIVNETDVEGNIVNTYFQDIFTGSLLYFKSYGYNRFGVIDFSQILVPVGITGWESLCRKHYPKTGDLDGVDAASVLDFENGATYSGNILSVGVDTGSPAPLYYRPKGSAVDQAPGSYTIEEVLAEYSIAENATDNFLEIILRRIETHYSVREFFKDFKSEFDAYLQSVDMDDETAGNQPYTDIWGNPILALADVKWFGPAVTWPGEVYNYAYIEFWHKLDQALQHLHLPGMGPELLGDDAWQALFSPGILSENPDIYMKIFTEDITVRLYDIDQIGQSRPVNTLIDIGAVELADAE